MSVIPCPVCQADLELFTFHGVQVDTCPKGCGIWFDYGELAQVEESDSLREIDDAFVGEYSCKPVKDSMEAPARKCPRHMDQILSRYEWNLGSGIVIDKCLCGGIWLDAGELEGYATFVKRFKENPPELTPELKARLDKAKLEASANFEKSLSDATRQTWDFGLLDDFIRFMKRAILRKIL